MKIETLLALFALMLCMTVTPVLQAQNSAGQGFVAVLAKSW